MRHYSLGYASLRPEITAYINRVIDEKIGIREQSIVENCSKELQFIVSE